MTWNYTIPKKKGRRVWRLGAVAAVVLVFAGVHMIRARHRAAAMIPVGGFVPWQHSMAMEGMDTLPADVYPSKQAAAVAAAERLSAAIASTDPDPQRIWVFLGPDQDGEVFATRIRQAFPEAWWKTGVENGDEEPLPGTVFVRVVDRAEPERSAAANSFAGHRGSLELRVNGQHGSTNVMTHYDSRAWLSDFSSFANAHFQRTWIVAHSRRACTSPAEARADAESDAAITVADLIHQRLAQSSRRPINGWRAADSNLASIGANQLICDRFVQHYHRPYGELWSEAILLDVSPGRLDPLINERLSAVGHRDVRAGRTVGAVAVVLVVILLTYLFLNAITKSYFTGRLRAGAVAAVAGLLLAAAAIMM
ncbi:MAG: hypothetical protein JWN51_854 [Phycisphaerales bacterium]|nr:hypothetical protein [Phycisphaerales bacterium]